MFEAVGMIRSDFAALPEPQIGRGERKRTIFVESKYLLPTINNYQLLLAIPMSHDADRETASDGLHRAYSTGPGRSDLEYGPCRIPIEGDAHMRSFILTAAIAAALVSTSLLPATRRRPGRKAVPREGRRCASPARKVPCQPSGNDNRANPNQEGRPRSGSREGPKRATRCAGNDLWNGPWMFNDIRASSRLSLIRTTAMNVAGKHEDPERQRCDAAGSRSNLVPRHSSLPNQFSQGGIDRKPQLRRSVL